MKVFYENFLFDFFPDEKRREKSRNPFPPDNILEYLAHGVYKGMKNHLRVTFGYKLLDIFSNYLPF